MSKRFCKTYIPLIAAAYGLICLNSVQADIGQKVNSIVKKQSQKKVVMAVEIVRPDNGTVIYSYNSHLPLTPASNMKLITSSAAVSLLGADYKFTTRVGLLPGFSGDNRRRQIRSLEIIARI